MWSQDAVITLQSSLDCTLWDGLHEYTLTQLSPTLSSMKMFTCLSGSLSRFEMINPGLAGQLRPKLRLRMRHTELAMWPSTGRSSQVGFEVHWVYRVRSAELSHGIEPRSRPSSSLITLVRFGRACSGSLGSHRGLLLHLKSALVCLIS